MFVSFFVPVGFCSVIAMAVASKVVGRELGEADQANLVDSFIDELGDEV